MGGVNHNTLYGRREQDLARAIAQPLEVEPVAFELFKIVSSTAISGGVNRHLYTMRRARVGNATGYAPAVTSNAQTETGLSVSELSNASSYWSYGVLKTNVPAGFSPQPIPDNTYVLAVPHRIDSGTLVWLIINTQAIDGACP